ncbi:substrate-binding periplasmic protein [Silvanigrella sp.]|jgi:ABC-type amino acid transport substrate-binding protein|uniref:substrate-binding periplasmic protein n=1 Tax=Silvanigrella sp. TaxID=2024976 RepID=UPI0037CB2505
MMLKRLFVKISIAVSILLMVFTKHAFAEELSLVKQGILTISHDDSFAPFGFAEKNAQGKYLASQGFEIDLLNNVAQKMGLKAEFIPNAWAKVLVSVKVNTADAIATIGINEERKKSYDYSEPYANYAAILFVPKEKTISNLKELNGKKMGIQKNHFSVPWIRDHYPKIEMVTFENAKDCFLAALSGKVEGAVADKLVGLYTIKQNSELGDKLKLVGDEFASTPVALAFAKGQKKQLRKKFNDALIIFQKSNDYNEIFNKWFGIKTK